MIKCKNCKKEIRRLGNNVYIHVHSGLYFCDPVTHAGPEEEKKTIKHDAEWLSKEEGDSCR